MGLVLADHVLADEPASWKVNDGYLLHEALQGAIGKPGTKLKVWYAGTKAPAPPGHWWPELVDAGSDRITHVTCFEATPKEVEKRWDCWHTIRKVNPLMSVHKESREYLLSLRDKARGDSRLKASFCSYRLNNPTRDQSIVLLTVADFRRMVKRQTPERDGFPVAGLGRIGAGRAWSSAVGVWPGGRVECYGDLPRLAFPGSSRNSR